MEPDKNVSAQHFSQLAKGLHDLEYNVEAWPSNTTRLTKEIFPYKEKISNLIYKRVNRPKFNQNTFWGRILNSVSMNYTWCYRFIFTRKKFDSLIMGSDPIFSYICVIWFKLLNPKLKVYYWAFDLHPETSVSYNTKIPNFILKFIFKLAELSYKRFNKVISLSECMDNILFKNYGLQNLGPNIVPWAINENNRNISKQVFLERTKIFGEAKINIMYSGNYGKCHDLKPFLSLAKFLEKDKDFGFCIAGNAQFDEDILRFIKNNRIHNINFANSVEYSELECRLKSADFHFVSIKDGFSGTIVPSKLFGALAINRPVIVCADINCKLGSLVEKISCGIWIESRIKQENLKKIKQKIENLARSNNKKKSHYKKVYDKYFSKNKGIELWDGILSETYL